MAEKKHQMRSQETEVQGAVRREKDRERHDIQRKRTTHKIPLARDSNPQVEPLYLGPMSEKCPFCSALRFPQENKNCCQNGKVKIDPLSQSPYTQAFREQALS